MKAIIIDDEKPARQNLITTLQKYFNEIEIIAEADSVITGLEVLSKNETDVVFLDINLFDGSGFNILEQLEKINFQVVFVTAYDNYAVQAFKVNALDYILKPIVKEELIDAVNKVKQKLKNTIKTLQPNTSVIENTRLAISESDGVRYVDTVDVLCCTADGNYTKIYLLNGEKIISSKTLLEYSRILEQVGFFRIHKSNLVSLNRIKKIHRKNGVQVEMESGIMLDVSRRKKEALGTQMHALQLKELLQ